MKGAIAYFCLCFKAVVLTHLDLLYIFTVRTEGPSYFDKRK